MTMRCEEFKSANPGPRLRLSDRVRFAVIFEYLSPHGTVQRVLETAPELRERGVRAVPKPRPSTIDAASNGVPTSVFPLHTRRSKHSLGNRRNRKDSHVVRTASCQGFPMHQWAWPAMCVPKA